MKTRLQRILRFMDEWAVLAIVIAFAIFLFCVLISPAAQSATKSPIVWEQVDEDRIKKGCEKTTGNLIYRDYSGGISVVPGGCVKETDG